MGPVSKVQQSNKMKDTVHTYNSVQKNITSERCGQQGIVDTGRSGLRAARAGGRLAPGLVVALLVRRLCGVGPVSKLQYSGDMHCRIHHYNSV